MLLSTAGSGVSCAMGCRTMAMQIHGMCRTKTIDPLLHWIAGYCWYLGKPQLRWSAPQVPSCLDVMMYAEYVR